MQGMDTGHRIANGSELSPPECQAVLQRVCFGHLAFLRDGHVDVRPVRYAFVDNWTYFRADIALRDVIARQPWMVLSVTEHRDSTNVASVVASGGCYEAQDTGSHRSDQAAIEGILQLRDRPTIGRARNDAREFTVFRLHADQMRGMLTSVPCPAGNPHGAEELRRVRDAGPDQSIAEDERADDDGMAAQPPAAPHRSSSVG